MPDTITESVVWTLCPNGRDKLGNLHFSVFVAPRLIASAGKTTLATQTAWQDWPSLLDDCTFAVVVPGASDAPRHIDRTSAWSSEVYRALFPGKTPVISYNTDRLDNLKSALILSYPVKTLADHMETLYAAIAASSEDMPAAKQLKAAGWPGYRKEADRTLGRFSDAKRGTPHLPPPPSYPERLKAYQAQLKQGPITDIKAVFEAFSLYHTPLLHETPMVQQHQKPAHAADNMVVPHVQPAPKATALQPAQKIGGAVVYPEDAEWPGYVHPKLPDVDDLKAVTDFHKIAAALSNYHQLSRLCGFVIDFTMPKAVADGLNGKTPLALQVLRHGHSNTADTCATTMCVVTPGAFAAFDATADHDNGFVRMADAGLDLVQLDVDGAAHKAVALGSSLERMTVTHFNDDDTDTPRQDDMQTSTPSLRSAGLMLARTGRGHHVTARALRNAHLHGSTAPVLEFGDLLRGYRADILDASEETPRWRSLHRRNIQYTFRNAIGDTGGLKWHTEGGKTKGTSPEEEGVISTSVGSSPDGSVSDVYTLHEGIFVWRGWSLSAPEPFKTMRHRTDKSLPETDHASMIGSNEAEVPTDMPLETRFVVRPDPNGNLPRLRFGHSYSVRLRTVDMCGNSQPLSATAGAGAVTPAVPYLRYEPIESPVITLSGKAAPGDKTADWKTAEVPLQGESMTRMALRTRNAAFASPDGPETPAVHRMLWPPRVTQRFAEQHGVLDDEKGKLRSDLYVMLVDTDDAFAEASVPPSDLIRGPKPMPASYGGPTTSYAVSNVANAIPYLPDPLALRARVRLLQPDNTWKEGMIAFHDPAANLDLAADRRWDTDGPHIHGVLIEGREDTDFHFDHGTRTLYVPMPRGRRQRLRISFMVPPSKLKQMALYGLMDKKAAEAMADKIVSGRHWMFTPWREIELVHAVQKPLKLPLFTKLDPLRLFRAGDVDLTWSTPVDGHSTGRIDLTATWNEPDDNSVSVDAKTRPVHRPHSAQVSQQPIARRQGSLGKTVTHHFHDTRARRVSYRMDAISRFKEFFEQPLRDSEEDMKITSAKGDAWIKSSARPPAPVVLYAIPTFGWFSDTNGVAASRRTGGIRVWLDRPWLATGYNEMLAVLLPDENEPQNDTDPNNPFVTQWGRDPIWLSSEIPTSSPRRKNFPLARFNGPIEHPGAGVPAGEGNVPGTFTTTGLQVPKQAKTCSVAPHQVGFDKDRELWYADIAVDIPKGSYFPFIRLAVARYQPMSLAAGVEGAVASGDDVNLHLSSPVTCDFMQISADRIAVVVPTKGNACRVVVFGDAAKDPGDKDSARTRPNVIRVRTQVLDKDADPVAGWRDAAGKPQPGSAPIIADTKADTALPTAKAAAARLVKRDITEPLGVPGKVSAAPADGVASAVAIPDILFDGIVFLPETPADGHRRVLITESEVYPHAPSNHEEPPFFAERIVYAEGLEV